MTLQNNSLLILGSGTSTGVPTLGCKCPVCTSTNPKNKRYRTSVLLKLRNGKLIIVDTTPDMRTQLLKNNIDDIHAAIITHDHADHVHGIDDLRAFNFRPNKKIIPVYTCAQAASSLPNRFPYIFKADEIFSAERPVLGGGIPRLTLNEVKENELSLIEGEPFRFFLAPHGHTQTLCFIYQHFGYATDINQLPDHIVDAFAQAKLDILIIDCLRLDPHDTHLGLEEALQYAERIKARFTGLIHLSHHLEHETLEKKLKSHYANHPEGRMVAPVFDGQIFPLQS